MTRPVPSCARTVAPRRVMALLAATALLAGTAVTSSATAVAADPADEPDRQYPFACTVQDEGLGQPRVDNQDGEGIPVYEEDEDGTWTPDPDRIVGYSRDCDADTRWWYYAVATDGNLHVVRDHGDPGPDSIVAALPDGVEVATTELVDVDGVTEVPYLIRHERGVINRFIHGISMLATEDEVLHGEPTEPDDSLWNGRLLYQFQGGVGIGHSQGRFDDGSPRARGIKGEPDRLSRGYAVAYSTATRTGDHYNLMVGGRTAEMVKARFVEAHGDPRYTVGIGGSGGGIQQYVYNQNHPDLLDAAIPQRSYPDMSTQTIHVGDCALLDRWMDVDRAEDPTWRDWDNRRWIQGLNSIEGYLGSTARQLQQIQQALGLPVQTGSSECLEGWFGLSPLAMNPHFGSESNWHLLGDQVDAIERTHWDDVREVYGTDPDTGFARVPWDNVGVQYGLQAVADGRITPEQFLDLNARVGSWKQQQDMIQEGFPFVGSVQDVASGEVSYDPWSARNANLSPDDGTTPAPRRAGDEIAIANAYGSGLVYRGTTTREIPIIEARDHLEHVLDMHNSHQSFAVRQRLLDGQGHHDNQVIWWQQTDTSGDSDQTAFYDDAFDLVAAWIGELEADPTASVAEARPDAAVDRCVDAAGVEVASGADVWAGILDDGDDGACTQVFDIHTTSRMEAGAPITGDVYKCRTMPVATAVDEQLYGAWEPTTEDAARLGDIHPDGVCDYDLPGVADPRAAVPDAVTATGGAGAVTVTGVDPAGEVQLRQGGEVVATAAATAHETVVHGLEAGTYVVAQVVDGQRSPLTAPVEVTEVTGPRFTDVPPSHAHVEAIERMAARGVVLGFRDGTFRPAAAMSRGQLAAIVTRALDLPEAPHPGFRDVPEHHTHAADIAAADAAGLMVGRGDGSFAPAERLTRGQVATVLARVERLDPLDDGPFPDVGGDVHAPNINAAHAAGLVRGYEDGTYRPRAAISRAQVAVVFDRLLTD